MTDLFAAITPTKRQNKVGEGNGRFLADLADRVSDEVMRQRFSAGEYDPIHRPSIKGWRRLNGRSNEGTKK